ncbi:MAG: bifunctional phosphopantothenoylcysteine decarboxylase/phosphopantothenate--cysteine ligase CoaBC [Actinomycetota bacterium]
MLLGVCGGIAAYKAVELARSLGKAGARVQVVMTDSATSFVGTLTFASLTKRPVFTNVFEEEHTVLHVKLAREADVVVVAPATANAIAKMANGIADDLLTNVLLTAACPVVVAPAMHTEMWEHPATRTNVETLRTRGISIVEPESGELAGGDEGVGRLAEPSDIARAVAETLTHGRDLAGVRFVVTAGGTQEPIDPVRYITNRSSGKMGYAVAREAAMRGARVTLVTAPTSLPVPERVDAIHVRTVQEMRDAVVELFDDTDVVVKAAAVSDFRVANVSDRKIKKADAGPAIELALNPDIAAELGARKTHQLIVGFAAETDDHLAGARKKLAAKNLDMIVLNNVRETDAGFEVDTNRVVILGNDGTEEALPLMPKSQVARELCDRIVAILRAHEQG